MTTRGTRAIFGVAVVYLIAGLLFGALAGRRGDAAMRVGWRLAAWLVSSIAFGAHIVYEHVRLRRTVRGTALHVSSAAALGAFGLAAAANIHALTTAAHRPPLILALSLAIWPVLTGVPAFVVAWLATLLLARVRLAAGYAKQ